MHIIVYKDILSCIGARFCVKNGSPLLDYEVTLPCFLLWFHILRLDLIWNLSWCEVWRVDPFIFVSHVVLTLFIKVSLLLHWLKWPCVCTWVYLWTVYPIRGTNTPVAHSSNNRCFTICVKNLFFKQKSWWHDSCVYKNIKFEMEAVLEIAMNGLL